jgi:hypothetical protein
MLRRSLHLDLDARVPATPVRWRQEQAISRASSVQHQAKRQRDAAAAAAAARHEDRRCARGGAILLCVGGSGSEGRRSAEDGAAPACGAASCSCGSCRSRSEAKARGSRQPAATRRRRGAPQAAAHLARRGRHCRAAVHAFAPLPCCSCASVLGHALGARTSSRGPEGLQQHADAMLPRSRTKLWRAPSLGSSILALLASPRRAEQSRSRAAHSVLVCAPGAERQHRSSPPPPRPALSRCGCSGCAGATAAAASLQSESTLLLCAVLLLCCRCARASALPLHLAARDALPRVPDVRKLPHGAARAGKDAAAAAGDRVPPLLRQRPPQHAAPSAMHRKSSRRRAWRCAPRLCRSSMQCPRGRFSRRRARQPRRRPSDGPLRCGCRGLRVPLPRARCRSRAAQ